MSLPFDLSDADALRSARIEDLAAELVRRAKRARDIADACDKEAGGEQDGGRLRELAKAAIEASQVARRYHESASALVPDSDLASDGLRWSNEAAQAALRAHAKWRMRNSKRGAA